MLDGLCNMTAAYTLSISEIASGSHTAGARHYKGTAPMDSCRRAGATQLLGAGDLGHDAHVHCAW